MNRFARQVIEVVAQLLLAACYLWAALWLLLLLTASRGACNGPGPNQIEDALPPAMCLGFVAGGVVGAWGCSRWLRSIRHSGRVPTGFDVLPPR